ncbi:uncharacterized protein LOC131306676 isoform X3 [Rhododendron vialii]|uniref:uncharacterized protein LOC131306676 isoform X3 n=1 Tax=Rhododendron vialii TaxID=182163 RepID=UPI00265E9670|nr:uncharacterized protein LOC131306676 isoform X3 [Rhododendron vialii]
MAGHPEAHGDRLSLSLSVQVLGIEHKDMNYLIEFPTWWSFRFQNAAALDLRFVESEVCLGRLMLQPWWEYPSLLQPKHRSEPHLFHQFILTLLRCLEY